MVCGLLRRWGAACPTALGFLLACQSTPFLYVDAADAAVTEASQTQPNNVVDILFVVDNSASMGDKQTTLKNSSAAFVAELAASNVDYRLGLVTTDLVAGTDGGRLRRAVGAPLFLSAPAADDPNAAAARATLVANFNAAVSTLGIGGSSQESALGAVTRALASVSGSAVARFNGDFLRPLADLAVIMITDEDDCAPLPGSEATVAGWEGQPTRCYDSQQELFSPSALVDQFIQIKGDAAKVRVALITSGRRQADGSFTPLGCNVGTDGAPDSRCGCWLYAPDAWFCNDLTQTTAQPCSIPAACASTGTCSSTGSSCDRALCGTTAPHRYLSFLTELAARRRALGLAAGTYVDSICQADYRATLIAAARAVVLNNCFALALTANRVALGLRVAHLLADGSRSASTLLQRYGLEDPFASCRSCSDCNQQAWQLVAGDDGTAQICLACGTAAQAGDLFEISTLGR